MVYVQDINGKPMMPTTRHGKVRRLLKDKKAVVVNLCPFTIKLMYVTSDYKQEIVLGVDAGTKHVGLSATTKSKELHSSEVILRNDIVDLLSTRRELRRTRRNRLRYRKPRFDNRIKSKRPGWVAPSVKYKVDAHIRVIDNVCSILPISRIVIEVAQFDTQKIKNPNISGKEYQEGDQLGFWNVRELYGTKGNGLINLNKNIDMNRWFEITVKAEIDNIENGKKKKVTEKYLVDALSYTEAESRSLEIFKDLYNSFEVVKINPIKVSEIFFNGEAEYWYKCKVNYITLDEKKGKEKKTPCYMYVQAGNPKDAEAVLTKGMQGTLGDWNCEAIAETKIIDVFKYDLQKGAEKLGEKKSEE